MKIQKTIYKGYEIEKRIDIKNNSCLINKSGQLIKAIAGDILKDGSENSIEKAKQWIDAKN